MPAARKHHLHITACQCSGRCSDHGGGNGAVVTSGCGFSGGSGFRERSGAGSSIDFRLAALGCSGRGFGQGGFFEG